MFCMISLSFILSTPNVKPTRFRWASLQLQMLCGMNTDEAIRERVGRLPPKLGDLYREIHDQITNTPEADFRVARHAFSWLICALQPLESEDFLTAISISPGGRCSRLSKDQVLAICRNFIIYDSSLDIFRFAHLSVREFLESQEEYHSSAAHSIASASCLSQLISNSSDPKVKSFLSPYSKPWLHPHSSEDWFHTYASVYWALHCQLAATQRARGTLKDLFLFFCQMKLRVRRLLLFGLADSLQY
jgi:hypothetical protein